MSAPAADHVRLHFSPRLAVDVSVTNIMDVCADDEGPGAWVTLAVGAAGTKSGVAFHVVDDFDDLCVRIMTAERALPDDLSCLTIHSLGKPH